MILMYLLNILILGVSVWWMWRQKWTQELQPYFVPALGLRLLLVVGFVLAFMYGLQGGDRTVYHEASNTLYEYAKQHPSAYLKLLFTNRFESKELEAVLPFTEYIDTSNSFFFVKLLSLLNFLTSGNYFLNNLYLAIYSFWGCAFLAAVLAQLYPKYKSAAAVAFLFFPTVLYWSVGLMKDPLMYGSMCWLTGFAVKLARGGKLGIGTVLLVLFHVYILVRIRIFFAALLLPLLLVYVLVMRLQMKYKQFEPLRMQLLAYAAVVTSALVLVAITFRDALLVDYLPLYIHKSYAEMLPRTVNKPHLALEGFEPTILSLFQHYPEAVLSTIYRPFIGESWNIFYVLSGLENLLLLLLTGLAVASAFRKGASIKVKLLHVVLLTFILVMAGVVGLTTPNFGTLSRYRLVFLPFLVYLLLQNVYAQRLLHRLRQH